MNPDLFLSSLVGPEVGRWLDPLQSGRPPGLPLGDTSLSISMLDLVLGGNE